MERIGIYLHIPFCKTKCPYCDFYSIPFSEGLADAYTAALLRAMETQPFGDLRADTVYLGGGTPSLMGLKRLDALLSQTVRLFGLDGDSEITLEANPDTVAPALLSGLRRCGYNRISFGVQSADDRELAALGRPHTAGQARDAILAAYTAGFENISADLMLGVPRQTLKSLEQSVEFLKSLPVRHISAYMLSIEPGAAFYHLRDGLPLPNEDEEAALYLVCVELLQGAGFTQYEVSNFAREGAPCRHNLKYWRCEQYLGLGPAAHSFMGSARYFFGKDTEAFINTRDVFSLLRCDGAGGGIAEQLMLRLRLSEGFDTKLPELRGARPDFLLEKARELSGCGLCTVRDGVISLTAKGFLLSNTVTAALLGGNG